VVTVTTKNERDRAVARARQRALTRLTSRFPDEFEELYVTEMRHEGYVPDVAVDERRFWVRRDTTRSQPS
jgi:hypothetical protein